MKDIEGLVRVELAVLNVWAEEVVVRAGIPLMKKDRKGGKILTLDHCLNFLLILIHVILLHSGQ